MTTPADWYPDPEDPTGLRYWDGNRWTEHRTPAAPPPPAPAEPPAPAPAPEPIGAADEPHGGAHRGQDLTEEPSPESYTPTPSQPYDTHPRTSHAAANEAPAHEVPSQGAPAFQPPSYEPQRWDTPYGSAPPASPPLYGASPFAPPPGPSGPSGPSGPNKKLAYGIIGGALAILLAIIVVLVVVLVRKDDATVTAAPATSSDRMTTSTSATATETPESSPAEAPAPPPTDAQGADGDFTFSVASVETGDTITSTVSDSVETTADGMYYVVHLNVGNTGAAPLTFVATFQALNAAGQTFPLDDEATAFLDGTIATIDPGAQVETALVYDVPAGTEPDSILLKADPSTTGVELPLR